MRFLLLSHVWCIYFRRFWVNKSSMRKIICSTVLPQNQDKVIHTWCTTFTLYSLFLHFKEEDRRIQTKLIMMARWTAASTSIQTWLLVFHFLHPKHEKCKVLFSTAVLTFWSTLMRWFLNLWEGSSQHRCQISCNAYCWRGALYRPALAYWHENGGVNGKVLPTDTIYSCTGILDLCQLPHHF